MGVACGDTFTCLKKHQSNIGPIQIVASRFGVGNDLDEDYIVANTQEIKKDNIMLSFQCINLPNFRSNSMCILFKKIG